MNPYLWIRNWWWARQRAIDLTVLWPLCKRMTSDLDNARAAFAVHALTDNAWVKHYGLDGAIDEIGRLT